MRELSGKFKTVWGLMINYTVKLKTLQENWSTFYWSVGSQNTWKHLKSAAVQLVYFNIELTTNCIKNERLVIHCNVGNNLSTQPIPGFYFLSFFVDGMDYGVLVHYTCLHLKRIWQLHFLNISQINTSWWAMMNWRSLN